MKEEPAWQAAAAPAPVQLTSRPTYADVLAACELFASFASALCLPSPVIDRVLSLLLTTAQPPTVGVSQQQQPRQSKDEELFTHLLRAAYRD